LRSRGSRLAQILQQTKEIESVGDHFDPAAFPEDPATLSVLGIGDFANALLWVAADLAIADERIRAGRATVPSLTGRFHIHLPKPLHAWRGFPGGSDHRRRCGDGARA
jgi:hypothetical protein